MSRRWLVGALVALFAATITLTAGSSRADAASADASLVPSYRLTTAPFRSIALVTVGRHVVCTGFVVAPRKVVTAGHCLVRDAAAGDYRFRTRLPERVRIFRGYSRAAGSYAYAACDVAKVWVPGRFVRSGRSDQRFGDRAYDFAVLTTRFGCRYPSNSVLRLWANEADGRQLRDGQRIRLAGYPADPRDPDMNGLSMWRSQGRIQPIADDAAHLGFTGFVAQGMSGAPVWRTFTTDSPCGRRHCVVGVVTECAVDDNGLCKLGNSTRVAVRITHKVKRAIRRH